MNGRECYAIGYLINENITNVQNSNAILEKDGHILNVMLITTSGKINDLLLEMPDGCFHFRVKKTMSDKKWKVLEIIQ